MDKNIKEIRKLIDKLNDASRLYYNGGESPLSDREFDQQLRILKLLEDKTGIVYADSPNINVGAPVLDEIRKVKIQSRPMLSLDKAHTAEEIINFADGYDLIASVKCDGLSVRLIYEDGKLISANTRGNGEEGSDISEHIKYFLNVPLAIAKEGKFIIDGEAIIFEKDFDIINKNGEFKNRRNAASGALALLDMAIVKNRRLSFIAWDIIEGGNDLYYNYRLDEAEELGFTTVPAFALDATKVEKEEINYINVELLEIAKDKGILCDGIVWKINDIPAGEERGRTEKFFKNAIAWKPEIDEYETELIDIEWSLGRTGVLTPIAVFKPVNDGISTIERASLHNLSVMQELLGMYPEKYQKIYVVKANAIIPQISRAEYKNNTPHDHILSGGQCNFCPVCGEPTEIVESDSGVLNVVCGNPSCEGKLENIIDHYLGKKGLEVKGISKMTIRKLIEWGWINGLTDIYKLDRYKSEWESKTGFGAASVGKILSAINASRTGVQLDSFISALGIPLIGRAISKEIVKYYPTWEEFRGAVGSDWTYFDGFGPEMSRAINSFNYETADVLAGMFVFAQNDTQLSNEQTELPLKDKVFVITGKLSRKRDDIKAEIEALGGKVTSSVSSKTNYLICNDKNSTTGKSADAKRLGIKIISEEEYLNLKS